MAVSSLARQMVLAAADFRCQLAGCETDLSKYLLEHGRVPNISHIVAAADRGPRAEPSMAQNERDSAPNLMALCDECARRVDSPEGVIAFPTDALRAMKAEHEQLVAQRRKRNEPWAGPLGSIMYLNVARLIVDGARYGVDTSFLNAGLRSSFDDMSFHEAGRLMVFVDRTLPEIERDAVNLTKWSDLRAAGVGSRFLFWRRIHCRLRDASGQYLPDSLSVTEGPHVYFKLGAKKIAMPIQPRYLTSSSAHTWFVGSPSVIGIAQLRSLSASSAEMSPIAIAIPNTRAQASHGHLRTKSRYVDVVPTFEGSSIMDSRPL